VGALLTYMKGLRPAGKAALAFGSYGWAKAGAREVSSALEEMKFDIATEPIQSQFAPEPGELEACRCAGSLLADRALEIAAR
jgi:anaerobic nitric oxide reductase flavorubredoxin